MKLADTIYELRKKAGYSQEELAVKCNVSRQSVSKWESGSAFPEIEKLSILADIFDVSVDYLLGRSEEKKQVVTIEVPLAKEYEYISKWRIGNLPLIHVHIHRHPFMSRMSGTKQKKSVAKGVIAIGDIAFGLLSIGYISVGILSIGLLSFGLLVFSTLAIGVYAIGLISIAYMAFGLIAIGMYSLGVIAVAVHVAAGVVAIGDTAIGVVTKGNLIFEDIQQQGRECIVQGKAYDTWVRQAQLPSILRWILQVLKGC